MRWLLLVLALALLALLGVALGPSSVSSALPWLSNDFKDQKP